jgi:hypothetical protein
MEFDQELERIDRDMNDLTLNELLTLATRETLKHREHVDIDHFEKDKDLFEV